MKATPSDQVKIGVAPHESDQTTHYSVVDKAGNAVSVTYTINGGFGAQVIGGDTGFFLNDEMDDFTSKVGAPNMFGLVQGDNNSIQPGKRPLSSMAPTIVTKNGKIFMVTGSPGGSRIITITLESILNVIDHNMDVQAAVDTPRIHEQWMPDTVYAEPNALTPAVQKELEADGYKFTENRTWGSDEAIIIGTKDGKRVLYGANDDRATAGSADPQLTPFSVEKKGGADLAPPFLHQVQTLGFGKFEGKCHASLSGRLDRLVFSSHPYPGQRRFYRHRAARQLAAPGRGRTRPGGEFGALCFASGRRYLESRR